VLRADRRHPRFVEARVALDEARDGVYPNDHFAVVAALELA
jgi:hypothetical protein